MLWQYRRGIPPYCTTAKWEMRLSDIAKGKENKENFLKEIEEEIKKLL